MNEGQEEEYVIPSGGVVWGGGTMRQQFLVPDVDFVPVRQALSGGDLALYRYV